MQLQAVRAVQKAPPNQSKRAHEPKRKGKAPLISRKREGAKHKKITSTVLRHRPPPPPPAPPPPSTPETLAAAAEILAAAAITAPPMLAAREGGEARPVAPRSARLGLL